MEMDAQNTESETEKIGEERKDQWPIINSTLQKISIPDHKRLLMCA